MLPTLLTNDKHTLLLYHTNPQTIHPLDSSDYFHLHHGLMPVHGQQKNHGQNHHSFLNIDLSHNYQLFWPWIRGIFTALNMHTAHLFSISIQLILYLTFSYCCKGIWKMPIWNLCICCNFCFFWLIICKITNIKPASFYLKIDFWLSM